MVAEDRKQDDHAGGRLFVLPPELRDCIYRILFNKTYLVYGLPFHHGDPYRKPKREIKADLAILRTCKILHEEASLVLYSVAVFRFAIDYDAKNLPPSPPKALTDRMMNVDFILDQSFFDDYSGILPSTVSPSKLEPQAKTTMGRFTGNGIRRKTCGVLLWAVEYADEKNYWLSSPMAWAISCMTGFDQITIQIEDQNNSLARLWKLNDPEEEEGSIASYESSADEDGNEGSQDVENQGIPERTWRFTHQIRDSFKNTLGPSEVGWVVTRPGIATSLSLQFRPQKHKNHGKGDEKKAAGVCS